MAFQQEPGYADLLREVIQLRARAQLEMRPQLEQQLRDRIEQQNKALEERTQAVEKTLADLKTTQQMALNLRAELDQTHSAAGQQEQRISKLQALLDQRTEQLRTSQQLVAAEQSRADLLARRVRELEGSVITASQQITTLKGSLSRFVSDSGAGVRANATSRCGGDATAPEPAASVGGSQQEGETRPLAGTSGGGGAAPSAKRRCCGTPLDEAHEEQPREEEPLTQLAEEPDEVEAGGGGATRCDPPAEGVAHGRQDDGPVREAAPALAEPSRGASCFEVEPTTAHPCAPQATADREAAGSAVLDMSAASSGGLVARAGAEPAPYSGAGESHEAAREGAVSAAHEAALVAPAVLPTNRSAPYTNDRIPAPEENNHEATAEGRHDPSPPTKTGEHVVGGTQHAADGAQHAVGGAHAALGGAQHSENGAQHAVGGSQHAMGGAHHAVDGSQHAVDGAQHAVDGAPHAVNAAPHKVSVNLTRKRNSRCLDPEAAITTATPAAVTTTTPAARAASTLRLRPLCVDGRTAIELRLTPGHEVLLGRSSATTPNTFGICDPRVSRKHVHLVVGAAGTVNVKAVGSNPIQVTCAAGDEAGRTIKQLTKGKSASIRAGDQLQLVCEETVRELQGGNPNAWSGNLCCYAVELLDSVAASSLQAMLDVTDDSSALRSPAEQLPSPAKQPRLATIEAVPSRLSVRSQAAGQPSGVVANPMAPTLLPGEPIAAATSAYGSSQQRPAVAAAAAVAVPAVPTASTVPAAHAAPAPPPGVTAAAPASTSTVASVAPATISSALFADSAAPSAHVRAAPAGASVATAIEI